MERSHAVALVDGWFGDLVKPEGRHGRRLADMLPRANRLLLPREYLSVSVAAALAAGLGVGLVATLLWLLVGASTWWVMLIVLVGLALAAGVGTYFAVLLTPHLIAAERGSNIDDNLPFALDYMANLVGPGAPFMEAVERVMQQSVYGEVSVELRRLMRDIRVLGIDRNDAMATAIDRSPSTTFKEVLQGMASTLAAGGDMAVYLKRKSAELFASHKVRQKKAIDNLGLLSEMFVVIAVAAPLLMIIMLVTVGLFGTGSGAVVGHGFRLFTVLVPILYGAFTAAIMIYKPVT